MLQIDLDERDKEDIQGSLALPPILMCMAGFRTGLAMDRKPQI